jgi:hypothetical protein
MKRKRFLDNRGTHCRIDNASCNYISILPAAIFAYCGEFLQVSLKQFVMWLRVSKLFSKFVLQHWAQYLPTLRDSHAHKFIQQYANYVCKVEICMSTTITSMPKVWSDNREPVIASMTPEASSHSSLATVRLLISQSFPTCASWCAMTLIFFQTTLRDP